MKEYLAELGIQSYVRRDVASAAVAGFSPAVPARIDTQETALPPATAADVAAMDWETLRRTVASCTLCGLQKTRKQTVFGVGDIHAEWLVIGEAPGADEDRQGEPFVGRAGQLLDAMLRAIGLKRGENVYIANVLKSRPPGNRDPMPEEVAFCLPYLQRQIALIQPRVILVVGRIAAQNLLQTDTPIGKMRGRVHFYSAPGGATDGASSIPVVVTYHPAYLLRTPAEKRKAWADLKFAQDVFRRGRGPQ